jgi:hypothetical protein
MKAVMDEGATRPFSHPNLDTTIARDMDIKDIHPSLVGNIKTRTPNIGSYQKFSRISLSAFARVLSHCAPSVRTSRTRHGS